MTGGADETTSGRSSAGHADYVERSFNVFTQDHPLRARCIAMISNPYPTLWDYYTSHCYTPHSVFYRGH